MNWEQLLSTSRQCEKGDNDKAFDKFTMDDFDDDYLSIISSQAFRRLQDKTQVFPLDKSDFVRTRLTHSMEVSAVARQLGVMITQNTSAYAKPDFIDNKELQKQIPTIVACAALLHDTGNPPFGHYGESVIRSWFGKKFKDENFKFRGTPVGKLLTEQMKADFTNFEGNAQGLRIMSKSRLNDQSHDINLTYAVMNTLIKYPNPSHKFDSESEDVKLHKNGYYYAEEDIMNEICEATGTKLADGSFVRHPLVYIMEAADDIAYSTADLADSVAKECFTVDQFVEFFDKKVDELFEKKFNALAKEQANEEDEKKVIEYLKYHSMMKAESRRSDEIKDNDKLDKWNKEREALFAGEDDPLLKRIKDSRKSLDKASSIVNKLKKTINEVENRSQESDFVIFENWLEEVRAWLMYSAQFAFSFNYDSIMEGTYKGDLFDNTFGEDLLKIMKATMRNYVYDGKDMISMQLSARTVVESLLDNFISAVMYYNEDDSDLYHDLIDDRFVRSIPANFRADYDGAVRKLKEQGKDTDAEKLYLRFLMVTDYVSGMTDSYALNLYRTINGIG